MDESEELKAIKPLLSGGITPDIAAQRFTSTVATSYASGKDVAYDIWTLWSAINDAAQDISCDSSDQDHLVELIAAIKQLPPLMRGTEECIVWGGRVWDALPMFGATMRDDWNWFDAPSTDPNRAKYRRQWRNINAFAARLTATRTYPFDLYAIWAFREALEEEPWNRLLEEEDGSDNQSEINDDDSAYIKISEEAARQSEANYQAWQVERRSISILDGLVPAAAQWIFHTGYLVYNSEQEWEHGPTVGDPARGGDLWDGKRGFCRERWNLWRTRFSWVMQNEELMDETSEIARRALEVMNEIEGDPKADIWKPLEGKSTRIGSMLAACVLDDS